MTSLPREILELKQNCGWRALEQETLVKEIKKCVPFVGAGLSAEFGFPQWRYFIEKTAELLEDSVLKKEVENLINEGNYETAASKAYNAIGSDYRFIQYGKGTFDHLPEDFNYLNSAVGILPRIFSGLIITTNYDRVLQQVYTDSFRYIDTIKPSSLKNMRQALREVDKKAILKLHGDFGADRDFIFTEEAYNSAYNNDEFKNALIQLFNQKPLLFLGCSIVHDRFFPIWKDVLKSNPNFHHFAIMSMKADAREQLELEDELKKYNIETIWYPAEKHEYLKTILDIIAGKIPDEVPTNNHFVDWGNNNSISKVLTNVYQIGKTFEERINNEILSSFVKKFVYLTGLGGVGKTTLLNALYCEMEKFLGELPSNIKLRSFVFNDDWHTTLKSQKISIKDKNQYILFIDNLPQEWEPVDFPDDVKIFLERCQVFVTTRRTIDSKIANSINSFSKFIPIDLEMHFPRPYDLFFEYCPLPDQNKWKSSEAIKRVIELSGSHTLTLEILARHAHARCCGLYDDETLVQKLSLFVEDLETSKFNLSAFYKIGTPSHAKMWEGKITEQLRLLVNTDKLNSSQYHLMRVFSVLANAEFHPEYIKYFYHQDSMSYLLKLGWVKQLGDDRFVMHEVIKKLVHDKDNNSEISYLSIRELVLCLGKALSKRRIEEKGKDVSVFNELDTINHAQSIYDYIIKEFSNEQNSIDVISLDNPNFDDAFLDLVNNLFSSYDDIDLRDKAFDGSVKAEKMRRVYLDYAHYSYAVSANSIGYLYCHTDSKEKLGFEYLERAKNALDAISNQNDMEIQILRGKLLSNFGAYYQDCLRDAKKEAANNIEDNSLNKKIEEYYLLALDYHDQSLVLRQKLYDNNQNNELIANHLFIVKGNIASDHFYMGKIVESVKIRLSLFEQQQKFYSNISDRLYNPCKLIGDTCENIANCLSSGNAVNGASAEEESEYVDYALEYLKKARDLRKSMDNNKEIIAELNERIEKLEERAKSF